MKINFKILAKACWQVTKFPLLIFAMTFAIFVGVSALFYFVGAYAFPAVLILLGLTVIAMFTYFEYQRLMEKHRAEQRQIVDIILK